MICICRAAATIVGLDWALFHVVNGSLRGNDPAQDAVELFNAGAVFALASAAALTWFLARPGGSLRSKMAAASAGLAAALGLLANAALGQLWFHPRPFADHPQQTVLLVHHGADNSFPSDHATVAFAVAFAVLAFHRRLGGVFLVAAVLIGLARILVGVHYPVDVGASVLVGLASALTVTTLGRPYAARLVRVVARVTDPPVLAATRRIARARRSLRR